MVKQSGFYIYYEKNPQMQNYMIEKIPELSVPQEEEVHDDAVRAFRQIIQKKHSNYSNEDGGRTSVFSYAATACLALAVLTVGVQFYQNYSNGNKMPQEVTETASAVIKEKTKNVKTTVTQMPKITEVPKTTTKPKISATPRSGGKSETNTDINDGTTYFADAGKQEQRVRYTEKNLMTEKRNSVCGRNWHQKQGQRQMARTLQEAGMTETTAESGNSYVIKPGDTLYQISIMKYGTMEKVAEICQANGLAEDEIIYPGQIIVLP